jgi:hypothetical protein
MADIIIINPRLNNSYWRLEYAMPFLLINTVLPVATLPLLAALKVRYRGLRKNSRRLVVTCEPTNLFIAPRHHPLYNPH